MNARVESLGNPGPVPFSLRDAPSFIEAQFPVGRVSAESFKERSAVQGQLLTTLGTYWKGRKPLILVRATVLGCLLPATDDAIGDLRVFLLLMGMDDTTFARRMASFPAKKVDPDWPGYLKVIEPGEPPKWRKTLPKAERQALLAEWLLTLPYDRRLDLCLRPEDCSERELLDGIWDDVNAHLGTTARSIAEIVRQLGVMRYGHAPRLADTFCGGGSIPFEAARIGCEVLASDLNPVACMLTWGTFNVVGASAEARSGFEKAQKEVAASVEREIAELGVEHDADGNRAKAYLYCIETRCPKTGWMVPILPTFVISKSRNVVATLVPDPVNRRYDIDVRTGVSEADMAAAETGTLRDGRLVHPANPERDGVAIGVIRGDHRTDDGRNANGLRPWGKDDFIPHADDVFQERLYAIQWIDRETVDKSRQVTFFAAVSAEDLARERRVEDVVGTNLASWQDLGLIPDQHIVPGDNTSQPMRERGWRYWHHLFGARHLLYFASVSRNIRALDDHLQSALYLNLAKALDWGNRLCYYGTGAARESISHLFSNQAFNTLFNYGVRASRGLSEHILLEFGEVRAVPGSAVVANASALDFAGDIDLGVSDPPYADAINYHEITEFFIGWLRKRPPAPFDAWAWDSRRDLAVKGTDEKFRSDMVKAYRALSERMPDNGMQVVMFTHQDVGVWADLAAIMWAAGLRVTAAWNVVTEIAKPSGGGNYVQGTVLLVLRKRLAGAKVKKMDIEYEIETEVDCQLAVLNDLDKDWTSERLYTDGDLRLAAYAAALRVITGYTHIDGSEIGVDIYRKLAKGEKTVIRGLIEYAAGVANNKLVPEGFPENLWRDLDPASRFYVRMLDIEATGATKYAHYQDFARSFSVQNYHLLMESKKANAASLAGASALKGAMLDGEGFGSSHLRRILFAVHKTMQKDDPKEGLAYLRTTYEGDYWGNRMKLIEFAKYVSAKTAVTRPDESAAADMMAMRLEVDRL
ncbi:anti-phage-associated DUF1156 domain-containing protein [Methylobacterium sp. J-092]|uniref:anti-phage-associated DUF1156 domain-containing protein n=1 Tax=Methylobacterium sp. J-092 TaxID=2836667 RepID=UPI001FBAA561|nr:anti-phage-associated DUF1156 domain-containing protein [Methylobacterium sp. J-092]MCJ2007045.1 DUF1156 domain-containing protein [Methylobacterium sp. J-092]